MSRPFAPVAVLAGLVVAGCGSSVAGEPAVDPFAAFDHCAALTDDELRSLGADPAALIERSIGERATCQFPGDPYAVSVAEDPVRDVEFYLGDADTFEAFEQNRVNGRSGAAVVAVGLGEGCTQVMALGAGTVSVSVEFKFRPDEDYAAVGDPCVEALRIAEMIEPRLPDEGE